MNAVLGESCFQKGKLEDEELEEEKNSRKKRG
jgi:hypothetical protein